MVDSDNNIDFSAFVYEFINKYTDGHCLSYLEFQVVAKKYGIYENIGQTYVRAILDKFLYSKGDDFQSQMKVKDFLNWIWVNTNLL